MQSTSVEPVSRKHTRNVSLGRFIQQYRRTKVRHAGKKYDLYRPQLTCVLLVHMTSTHKPGSDTTIGERSNLKKIRTRMIMMMHSNERGECRPCTLVDHKRKRYDNAVDVVVRLHDRSILVPNVRTSAICTRSAR